jgi:hypothetical protein
MKSLQILFLILGMVSSLYWCLPSLFRSFETGSFYVALCYVSHDGLKLGILLHQPSSVLVSQVGYTMPSFRSFLVLCNTICQFLILSPCFLGHVPKVLSRPMAQITCPIFAPGIFIISGLIIESLIHF